MYTRILDYRTGKPSDTCIRRDSDGAVIPADDRNYDWLAFEEWRAAGNEPAPAPSPAPAAN